MNNPWLEIPLADYEGHMALPETAPDFLRERAAVHRLTEVESVRVTSLGGKSFQVQTFVAIVSPSEDCHNEL